MSVSNYLNKINIVCKQKKALPLSQRPNDACITHWSPLLYSIRHGRVSKEASLHILTASCRLCDSLKGGDDLLFPDGLASTGLSIGALSCFPLTSLTETWWYGSECVTGMCVHACTSVEKGTSMRVECVCEVIPTMMDPVGRLVTWLNVKSLSSSCGPRRCGSHLTSVQTWRTF